MLTDLAHGPIGFIGQTKNIDNYIIIEAKWQMVILTA